MNSNLYNETEFRLPPLQVAEIGDFTISYRFTDCQTGGGENKIPMVFLHGIGSNSTSWDGQFTELEGSRKLLAWDAPGYAKSTYIADKWADAFDYARRLKALTDYFGFKKIILVGQSLGAIIASAFAISYPEVIEKLIFVCPASGYGCKKGENLPPNVQSRIDDLQNLGAKDFGEKRYKNLLNDTASKHSKDTVKAAMQSVNYDGYMRATHLLAQSNLREMVKKLPLKPIIIYGESDKIIKGDAIQALIDISKTTEIYPVAKGSHALAIEFYHEFNQILISIAG